MARTVRKEKAYTGRDWALVALIKGATKAGVRPDQRAVARKTACRKPVRREEWA